MRVVVIGDATLDVTVRQTGDLEPGGDRPAEITAGPGGQGANVAVRLARSGVPVRLLAALSDDAAGRLLTAALVDAGVEVAALAAPRTGIVVALLDASGDRSMLSDRVSLDPGSFTSALSDAAWIHVSGYALADEATGEPLAAVLAGNRTGRRISVAGGSFAAEGGAGAAVRARLATVHPDLLIVGVGEAAALLGRSSPSLGAAAAELAGALPGTLAIVTGGRDGSAAALGGMVLTVPAEPAPRPVVDATGAGDAYAASLIEAFLEVDWPPDAAILREAMSHAGRRGALAAGVLGAQGQFPDETEPLP